MKRSLALLLLFQAALSIQAQQVDPSTLHGKVIAGYQGWFRTPTDNANQGWQHYRKHSDFKPGQCTIEFWPDTSEASPDEKFITSFKHADGSPAYVFSSHHPKTVDRHFKWMRTYGIDGVMVQRFANTMVNNHDSRKSFDRILRYSRTSANKHGRSYNVMYDLSSLPKGAMNKVIKDWKHLVNDLGILKDEEDKMYLHHSGKPLVAIWGIGFNDSKRKYTLDEVAQFIDFLKNDPKYGGCAIMLGIPTGWREMKRDSISDPKLHEVFKMADVLSPWAIGRIRSLDGIQAHADNHWQGDIEWCRNHDIDYLPTVFPGFSWHNMNPDSKIDAIPREDGMFLWNQYTTLKKLGAGMVYQAMFDEIDEGTQIFKISNNPPVGKSPFLTYKGLPEDHYLWLVGQATKLYRGEAEPAPYPPLRPGYEWIDKRLKEKYPNN